MTLREHELRLLRRFAAVAAAFAAIGVLQAFAGRWWVYAPAFGLAAFCALGAALSWWLAREAQPWQDAPPPKRTARLWTVFDAVMTVLDLLLALGAFVDGEMLDGFSWLLAAVAMWVTYRADRDDRRRIEPAKTPVRPGPPAEWL